MQDIPFFLNLTLNSELYIEIILKMGRKKRKGYFERTVFNFESYGPLIVLNFITRNFSILRIRSVMINMKYKTFNWKLLKKMLHAWIQFSIETFHGRFSSAHKTGCTLHFRMNLDIYVIYISLNIFYEMKFVKLFQFLMLSIYPFFKSEV